MQRAVVVGRLTATTKHRSLVGCRLLLMQPLGPGDRPDGDPLVVIDTLGAAVGATAIITSDGKASRVLVGAKDSPVRYTVIGLED
ncbi:MAG: EutN/CcmL family microcompartment protein [Planctomycetia bacterium]